MSSVLNFGSNWNKRYRVPLLPQFGRLDSVRFGLWLAHKQELTTKRRALRKFRKVGHECEIHYWNKRRPRTVERLAEKPRPRGVSHSVCGATLVSYRDMLVGLKLAPFFLFIAAHRPDFAPCAISSPV